MSKCSAVVSGGNHSVADFTVRFVRTPESGRRNGTVPRAKVRSYRGDSLEKITVRAEKFIDFQALFAGDGGAAMLSETKKAAGAELIFYPFWELPAEVHVWIFAEKPLSHDAVFGKAQFFEFLRGCGSGAEV